VFTAAEQEFADEVMDVLDTNGYISHRVYNVSNLVVGKLGRDLSKTVVVNKMES
jgi:TFIIF-interacting CTD phosphatase-like protein